MGSGQIATHANTARATLSGKGLAAKGLDPSDMAHMDLMVASVAPVFHFGAKLSG